MHPGRWESHGLDRPRAIGHGAATAITQKDRNLALPHHVGSDRRANELRSRVTAGAVFDHLGRALQHADLADPGDVNAVPFHLESKVLVRIEARSICLELRCGHPSNSLRRQRLIDDQGDRSLIIRSRASLNNDCCSELTPAPNRRAVTL
jgi:hypothetical protein